ncbi:MAG: endopeptidase La [Gammaproteobacteria bacterium]|nr:endopeptidase La [Rhodoferax sp.]MBU3898863.1 endopeptidase La [Gammaproteobacteria bacterium]MBU3999054.1 endopeptidase La [Gammaproteobacteria bacterium]MBU4019339.1 endopeptidase La [Gammaproteobacteria bacterium]MBU4081903.1 endopeptidase La [Gammaproteobacteria bacterium]
MSQVIHLPDKSDSLAPEDPMPELPDDALIVVPVRNMVLFPGMVVPISIGRESSIAAAQYAVKTDQAVGILMQKNPEVETPGPNDLSGVGTIAAILRYVTTPDGTHHIVCQGQQRFRVTGYVKGFPFTVARIERIAEMVVPDDREIEARFMRLKERAVEVLQMMPQVPAEMVHAVQGIDTPAMLADLVAGYVDIKAPEKQEILEEFDLRRRLDRVLEMLTHRMDVLKLSRDIDRRTKTSLGQREREFLLREQLKSIQKELGDEGVGNAAEINELRQLIEDADMPEEVAKQATKELKRLERMADGSSEYSMVRTYLDWLVELPWKAPEPDTIDVAQARQVLDADHFDLEKVKKRIVEFLAVRKLKPGGHGPILCLVGPPGVGKTSLGQSIARAMGRKFVRVSLGGVHDEAEIRGHRRTYIGALPGNIIQALKKAGTRGCVMMLDEIDKLGGGIQGDPSAALLEVLDPEQNNSFRDNYLAVPYDLSQVLFITTANVLDPIPGPLRDRMEVLHLSGYTQEEKREIARRYLVARQLDDTGLAPEQLEISDAALASIIRDYTREAGVRNLERQIGAVCRRVAVRIAEGEIASARVDAPDLEEVLGPAKFENEVALRAGLPGVATGLAWTPVGGDILFIEASRMAGTGRLILTGQLGDVMKESAQAALTLVKSRATTFGLDAAVLERTDVHIHVPAGAIPKDGPSAGVAMFIALASLFMNRPVRSDVAMTGEISLRGLVLPVGGIKEKILAALAAGIKTIMLPARNRKDLDEVPLQAREQLEFVYLDDIAQALKAAIELADPSI